MFGTNYATYPDILLDSFRDINSSYRKKAKLNLSNPVLRFLISSYLSVFGIPDISFQLRAKYFTNTIRSLTNLSPKNILDAGCGIGYYSQQLKVLFPTASLTGVDTDSHKIQFCRSLALPISTFQVADLVTLTTPANNYDLLVNVDVLEHIAASTVVLRNFYHLLAPGGYLYIHAPQTHQRRTFTAFFANWHHADHVREGFDPNQLASELKKAGFRDIKYHHGIGPLSSLAWELNQLFLSKSFILAGVLFPLLYLLTLLDNQHPRRGLTAYYLARK